MTVLGTANKVYLGAQAASKVYAGATPVWPPAVSGSLPLDNLIVPALFAVSYRKLRTAYAGPCCGVRRYSDNAYQEFGFVNNLVDTAGIVTFLNAGRRLKPALKPTPELGLDPRAASLGFVVNRFNQAPVATNTLQQNLTYGEQPQLYNGSAFTLPLGSHGGITEYYQSGGTWMYANSVPLGGTKLQVVAVGVINQGGIPSFAVGLQLHGTTDSNADCFSSPLSVAPLLWSGPRVAIGRSGATSSFDNTITGAAPGSTTFVHSAAFDGANFNQYFNGTLVASGTSTGTFDALVDIRVATDFDSHGWDGGLPEIILQAGANAADRTALEAGTSFWRT